jgi:hypothetical protein
MQVLHCGFLFQIWLRNAKATGVGQAMGSNGNTNVCCQGGCLPCAPFRIFAAAREYKTFA